MHTEMTVIGYLAFALFSVAILLFAAVPAIPSVLNCVCSALIVRKVSSRLMVRVLMFIAISAVMSWNLRFPTLKADHLGSPPVSDASVARKVVLGPFEKVSVKLDSPQVFYRRNTAVPSWGFKNNQWELGVTSVPMIVESPLNIIREIGIAVSKEENSRVSIGLTSTLVDGITQIRITVTDENGIAATYQQDARRNYTLEQLDSQGSPGSGWKGHFAFLTQKTPWNPTKELYPPQHAPIRDFFRNALLQSGATSTGKFVPPQFDSLDKAAVFVEQLLVREVKSLSLDRVPAPYQRCVGTDSEKSFDAFASNTLEVSWADKDIPPIRLPIVAIDGYHPSLHAVSCSGNSVWLASSHLGAIYAWRYEVNFAMRSLILKERLKLDIPDQVADKKERRFFWLASIEPSRQGYNLLLARHEQDPPSSGRFVPREGYLVGTSRVATK